LKTAAIGTVGAALGSHFGCSSDAAPSKKVIVLGIDGMDPNILDKLIADGRMPNFARLAREGSYLRLGTSIPPQSPVAWSDFITGTDAGKHGIYDFIHREPDSYMPYLSTSKALPPSKTISLGDWVIPLSSGKTVLLRRERAFWQILEEHGVPTQVIKMPANFPPAESPGISLSDMGTPDILGTYGTFSFFTDNPLKFDEDEISGGKLYPVDVYDGVVKAHLVGPENSFQKDEPRLKVPFTVYADSENGIAKVVVQDQEILLKVGQWSEWTHIKFTAVPYLVHVSGICRFYLKEVNPDFGLYVSPINIDPLDPAMPISTPDDFCVDLAHEIGCFYTQGLPEDTKALSSDVLEVKDYLGQANIVLQERLKMFDHIFGRFDSGLLFFYFGSLDQNSHMLWWLIDPKHPLYNANLAAEYGDTLYRFYEEMDKVLGKTLGRVDSQTTLIVISDHGFAPFYRGFNLNTWLRDNGYTTLTNDEEGEFYSNVNWYRTKAYALGLNGLYINLEGRESMGPVPASQKDKLLDEISQKLLQVRDPENGEQVILRVYKSKETFTNPDERTAPDAIVGYNRGYRVSWESASGSYPDGLVSDNKNKWSGDHCAAAEITPGVFLSNRKANIGDPRLRDITPTILKEFGIEPPGAMTGRPVF
jgi:predicted AlkP superfamily phosphohydrolase/phosphomutase